MQLKSLLSSSAKTSADLAALFALLTLGVIESLAQGLLNPTDAIRVFFHADNCLFVRKHLHVKTAENIMSRGLQLSDLFDALPAEEAHRQFQHELAAMRLLCLKLLESKQRAA